MASEAMPYADAGTARELAASQREAARRQQVQAAKVQIEEEETAELESQEEEARAARMLSANQRTASRGNGGDGGENNVVGAITDTAGEITDLISAVIEIETVIVPLILLANYHVRFLSGNLGAIPEAGGPLSYVLDKCMELASAGAKTVGKTAGKSAAGASINIGSLFDVKKLAIWQIFLGIVIDVLLVFFAMVNFLIMIAIPLIVAGGIAGTIVGFCTTYPDVCTSMGSTLTDIVSFFTH